MHAYPIEIVSQAAEKKVLFPLLRELRPHLTEEEFLRLTMAAEKEGAYRLWAIREAGQFIAAMGFRELHDLVHGHHLYIDDLVVTEKKRGLGLGAYLLRQAERESTRLGCRGLRLCTGVENEAGKRFYEKESWRLRAVVYKKFNV